MTSILQILETGLFVTQPDAITIYDVILKIFQHSIEVWKKEKGMINKL